MDVVESTTAFGRALYRDAAEIAAVANRHARRSGLYRYGEYHLAAQHGLGASALAFNQVAIDSLGTFDTHDQDKDRPGWARKLQLAEVSRRYGIGLAEIVGRCEKRQVTNPVVLRQLRLISDAVVGPRSNAQEARAYMRRAAVKLHPDKCADLEGWRIPNIAYSRFMPPDYKYEQAKWGAAGLYALHRSLDKLYANPYYAAALYEPAAAQGPHLSARRAALEYSLLSAAILMLFPEAAAVVGAGAAVMGTCILVSYAKKIRAARAEVTCRELIPYVEPSSAKPSWS